MLIEICEQEHNEILDDLSVQTTSNKINIGNFFGPHIRI